jgi:AcrR family transcriptional regulator
MPKIIENLREDILKEAKKQLMENGYAKTTIRSVASALGIGVGTIYNYYTSKDMLFSAFMLEDWYKCTIRMSELDPADTEEFFRGLFIAFQEFIEKYRFLFNDKDAGKALSAVFMDRHVQLRTMMAKLVAPACKGKGEEYSDPSFLANYVAESVLFFATSGSSIDDQIAAIKKLLNN